MKLLFVSEWYPANIGTFLSYAFEDAGYEVIRVGNTCFNHYGLVLNPAELPMITEKLPFGQDLDLPALVDKYKPDMLLMWDWTGEPSCYKVVNATATLKLKHRLPFIYVEHEGWLNALKRIELFNPTVAYTGMPYGVIETPCSAMSMGYKYLAGACYPKVHYINRAFEAKDLDFVVMASQARSRPMVCEAMFNKGFKIHYGTGGLYDYRTYHNRSIATYDYSDGWQYVKWRVFEAMAMGCILLQDSFELLESLGFRAGEHFIEYNLKDLAPDMDTIAEKITMLKDNPDIAKKIRQDAFDFVMKSHKYSDRVAMIEKDLEG
jgi:hypothetical protein